MQGWPKHWRCWIVFGALVQGAADARPDEMADRGQDDQIARLQHQLDEVKRTAERIQGQIDELTRQRAGDRAAGAARPSPPEPTPPSPAANPSQPPSYSPIVPNAGTVSSSPASSCATNDPASVPAGDGSLRSLFGTPQRPSALPKLGAHASFEDGFKLESDDERYGLSVRQLTQAEYVGIAPYGARSPGGFVIPRQRLYVEGWISEKFLGHAVTESAYGGGYTVLDAWLDAQLGDGPTLRFGRMRAPFMQEMYLLGEDRLISPERSLFNSTLTLYRQVGVMLHGGDRDDAQTTWAIGLFNGPENGDFDFNQGKDGLAFFQHRPFWDRPADDPLHGLECAISGQIGYESNGPPGTTNFELQSAPVQNAGATSVSPVFFAYRPDVLESGVRSFLGADVNWFYRRLNFYSAIVAGRAGYSRPDYPGQVYSSAFDWTLTGCYWLTGEVITDRRQINPLRPFRWDSPLSNPGALQLFSRWDSFTFGQSLIDQGFTVPGESAPWAHNLNLGLSWFPNRFTTVWFSFLNSWLGEPVRISPTRFTEEFHLFTIRMQIFF